MARNGGGFEKLVPGWENMTDEELQKALWNSTGKPGSSTTASRDEEPNVSLVPTKRPVLRDKPQDNPVQHQHNPYPTVVYTQAMYVYYAPPPKPRRPRRPRLQPPPRKTLPPMLGLLLVPVGFLALVGLVTILRLLMR